jgi:hypothetical protein
MSIGNFEVILILTLLAVAGAIYNYLTYKRRKRDTARNKRDRDRTRR